MDDKAIITILASVECADGLISRGGLMKLLRGQATRAILRNGLDHIDNLIDRGCLRIGLFTFPMIHITDAGRNRLKRMVKYAPPVPVEAPQIELDDIHVCSEIDFWKLFIADLERAKDKLIIVSAFVSDYRVNLLLPEFEKLKSRGVMVLAYGLSVHP